MDACNKEPAKRKTTSIPRLNKKISCESALTFSNEFQEDNLLRRCSSDTEQNANKAPEQCVSNANVKTKKLCMFTLNENLINHGKNENLSMSDAKATDDDDDDDVNSAVFTDNDDDEARRKCEDRVVEDAEEKVCENKGYLCEKRYKNAEAITSNDEETSTGEFNLNNNQMNDKETNTTDCSISSSNTTVSTIISNTCQQIPPLQMQSVQNQTGEELMENPSPINAQNQTIPQQSLRQAYLKQMNANVPQSHALNQYRWNVINPLYRNVGLGGGFQHMVNLSPRFVSDIDVHKLTEKGEESSDDIETDEEAINSKADSPRLSRTNAVLHEFIHNLGEDNGRQPLSNKIPDTKRESLVSAFFEVFGKDSHIIQKLRSTSPIRYDERFRKLKVNGHSKDCVLNGFTIAPNSPKDNANYERFKTKLVGDLPKNDDTPSGITQSSNNKSARGNPTRLFSQSTAEHFPKFKSNISTKSCYSQSEHSQTQDDRKSEANVRDDIHLTLEEIVVEITKLRALYDECLMYQRKSFMQNKKLHDDVQNMYFTILKLLETKNSGSIFKYLVLPILGVITYFVVKRFDLCNNISVVCDE